MIQIQSSATLTILLSVYCLCVAIYVAKLCRRALYSPLNGAKDAHWSVRYCGAWIWWQRCLERDAQAVHSAHLRLGPVIRLGPVEISVNDVDGGLKPIYEGRLPKTDFYQVANSYGKEPMVAMRDEERHRQRRKILAKPYGKTCLMGNQDWHVEQARLADDLVSGLGKLAKTNSELELYDVLFAWSVASTSTYIFGRGGSLNLLHNVPEAHRLREEYFSQRAYQFVGVILPFPPRVFHWMGYRPELLWIRRLQDQAQKAQKSPPKQAEADGWTPVYDNMKQGLDVLQEKQSSVDTRLSRDQTAILSSEMQDHFIAGIDTSLSALTACAWLLSVECNRQWQGRLREEARSVRRPSSDRELERLPFLNAVN